MKSVPGPSLFSAVDRFVDRAIGADGLTRHLRDKLLAQQMASVGQLFPAITAASLVVAALFMVLSWGSSLAWPMALCVTIILLLALNASRLAARLGDNPPAEAVRSCSRLMVAHAGLLGGLWGLAFNMLPSASAAGLTGTGTMGLGGLLIISAVALVNFPQALAAFTIPLIVGGLGALVGAQASNDLMVQGALLMAFTFVMVTVTFNHASAFVAHRASELAVKEKGEIIGLLLGEFEQTTSDWIWAFDAEGSLTQVSSGFTNATGVPESDLLGADFIHFLRCITPPQDPLMGRIEEDVAQRGTFQNLELRVTADGEERWWSLTGKPAYDETGAYIGYMGTTSDITERKAAERRITVLAHHDSMTGLLNRTKFTEQLGSCVPASSAMARRSR
jgi:PAS domain S-box